MGYSVKFAGVELNSYCNVLKVTREILPSRENFSKSIPSMFGSFYTGHRYTERTITLDISIVAKNRVELMQKVRVLVGYLDTKNPCKLEIDDEPNLYYYAVVDGSVGFEKLYNTGTSSITFLCNDPLAYSKEFKVFNTNPKKIFDIENNGTSETSPILEVDFKKSACFFQATNHLGQTVLIGKPKNQTLPSKPLSDVVLNDPCESTSNFLPLSSSLLDSNRNASGIVTVGMNGGALTCNNYGTASEYDLWTGAAVKRNLGTNLDEFEIKLDLVFSSEGHNYTVPPKPPVPPPPPNPSNPNLPNTNTYGTYQVTNCGGLWINKEPNTKNRLYAMPPKTKVYPTEKKGSWFKHTHKTKRGTFTGWSHSRYLKKISSKVVKSQEIEEKTEYAEYEMGLLEIYGFDQEGGKLFKVQFHDVNKFYEYVEPHVFVGSQLILDDGRNCPNPRVIKVKDDSGKETSKEVVSGVFGNFNDFYGNVVIKRRKVNNKYLWSACISKSRNGQIVSSLSTSNDVYSSNFSKKPLNYLGFYFGKYKTDRVVDAMGIYNVFVKRLNSKAPTVPENSQIFDEGDHMQINFNNGLVTLNDAPFLTNLDVGTEFFTIPTGHSQFAVKTDDDSADVLCSIQERYL